ncbi:MAG: InlB B-repeat-containing protein, partial [Atribacterota bacterium]|nr:InlB B-repeat-containing protein [Atribacterota bacterium]
GQSLGTLPTPPIRANYTFTSWNTESDGSGTEFTGSTFITDDITVYAQWLAVDYSLALSVTPINSGTATGEGIYHVSDAVQIIATPNTGFIFVNWTDDDNGNAIVSTHSIHDFTMAAANVNYTANFVPTYALTMAVNPIGSGTVIDNTSTSPYTEGMLLSISAVAKAGYEFINWSTTSVGTFEDATSASTTFTMPAEAALVTANFRCAPGYIYNGDEYDHYWTYGYIEGSGYYSKDNNYLYLTAGDYGAFAERSYVTDYPIDLTCINSIVIDWSNTGDDYDRNMSYLVVSSSSKHGNYDTDADARLERNRKFDRSTNTLNVSSLSGSYYIRVHARDDNSFQSGDDSRISVYSIELRK